jgi:hypothetical protein
MKIIVTIAPSAPLIPVIISTLEPLRPRAAYTTWNEFDNTDLNRNLLTCGLEVRGDVDPGELRAYLYGHPSKRTPQHRFRRPQVGELSTAQHQLET